MFDKFGAISKTAVTRLFVGGVVAMIAGVLITLAAVWAALAGGLFVIGGPSVVTVTDPSLAWTLIGLVVVGSLVITGGSIAAVISWLGALLNTAQLEDKTWFAVLLVLGLLSFGFLAMVAYVLAGPDGTRHGLASPAVVTPGRT